MALTNERRNEIAYRFVLVLFSDIKVGQLFEGLRRLCVESGVSVNDNERLESRLITDIGALSVEETIHVPKSEFCDMAWKIIIHYMYHKGFHLNDSTRREVGNYAKKANVSTDEAMEFMGLLSQEVHNIIFQEECSLSR